MSYFTKSKIFLYFCLSFSLGVFTASFFEIPILALYTGTVIAVILISIFWRKKKMAILGFCIIFSAIGVWRYQSVNNDFKISDYNYYLDKNIVFEGLIVEEPDVRIKNTQYIIEMQKSKITLRQASFDSAHDLSENQRQSDNNQNIALQNFGKILATLPHYPAYQYGDLIELEGKLKIPEKFNSFDYQEYLAKDDIYFTMLGCRRMFPQKV